MSTSLLYHGFGVRGYRQQRTDFVEGAVLFTIEQPRESLRCPRCGSSNVQARGRVRREYQTLPIGRRPVWIALDVPRVWCAACGTIRQVAVPFAEQRKSYTRSFERYALELLRHMTIRDVAVHLGVGWDLIKDLQKRHLQRHFARPKLSHLRRIAIDEISVGHGHRYLTVVLDLESGAVVHVGDGKGADALKPFWKRLRAAHARIEAVAIDMSPAYLQAVLTNLPRARIVFDRFHVVKLYNEKLSELRRELYREATDQLHKDVLKGTRWLLLKNPENLDRSRNEHWRLDEALTLNRTLATAYYMKELLRLFWEQPDKARGRVFLDEWIELAESSGVRLLQQFAKTLAGHRSGLLAWYDNPISTGPLEGTNTKIKLLQRQAYGFRDKEFFKLRILALHETKYVLVG
jgi:transposase